jgi:cation diffusion facilitator family transporter
MEHYNNLKRGERGAWISMGAYLVLSALKIGVGFAMQSKALTADGVNNSTDILVSIAVLIGLRISRKPPDLNHPYGHMRAETVASMIASFVMMVAGVQVLIQAGRSAWLGVYEAPGLLAAWVAVGSAVVMFVVYGYNKRLAKQINNQTLMSAALDNRSDALVSVGAAIGIFGARLGYPWLDPAAACAVGLMICKTAWGIFYEASHSLTDGFDESKLEGYQETIQEVPGVKKIKNIKARAHGSMVLLDVTVEVSAELSIEEGHVISDEIERKMGDEHHIGSVHVHIEPYGAKGARCLEDSRCEQPRSGD